MARFDEKVAIVSGVTGAMGATIATRLAEEGAAVVGLGRSLEAGQAVVAEIEAAGGRAHFVPTDVTSEEAVAQAVTQTIERFGALDVIVNNAAPMRGDGTGPPALAADLTTEQFEWPFRVCLFGPFWLAKYGMAHMVAAGGGAIVNISSGAASRGVHKGGGYGPAKAALEAFGRTLAVEYGSDNIRVNSIRLGAISVPGNAALHENPKFTAALQEARIVPRSGTPTDVAALVAFLASEESGFITGEVVVLDGGSAAKHRGVNFADATATEGPAS
jgi:meso-butanediol dehydrogenase / (S,S)-butanediol dehydrogenase / diacetyl reductase